MRLIDADALKEIIEDHVTAVSCCPTVDWSLGKTQMKKQVLEDIDNVPTADAEPVRHGRWIEYPEHLAYDGAYSCSHIVCSECYHVWDVIDNCTETFDYCPHCGALMQEDCK